MKYLTLTKNRIYNGIYLYRANDKIIYIPTYCQGKNGLFVLIIAALLKYLRNKSKLIIKTRIISFASSDVINKRYAMPMSGKRVILIINGAGGCCSRKPAMAGLTE